MTTEHLRCQVTTNPCGTDTWMVGKECHCSNCQTWLAPRRSDAELVAWLRRAANAAVFGIPAEAIPGVQAHLSELERRLACATKQHTCWECGAKVPRKHEDVARGNANTAAVVAAMAAGDPEPLLEMPDPYPVSHTPRTA